MYRETNGVRVFDMKTFRLIVFTICRNSERFHLDLSKVVAIAISPLNNWLVTLTPFKTEPNLQIWDCKTGSLHYSLVQKSFSRSVLFSLLCHPVLALFAVG